MTGCVCVWTHQLWKNTTKHWVWIQNWTLSFWKCQFQGRYACLLFVLDFFHLCLISRSTRLLSLLLPSQLQEAAEDGRHQQTFLTPGFLSEAHLPEI